MLANTTVPEGAPVAGRGARVHGRVLITPKRRKHVAATHGRKHVLEALRQSLLPTPSETFVSAGRLDLCSAQVNYAL